MAQAAGQPALLYVQNCPCFFGRVDLGAEGVPHSFSHQNNSKASKNTVNTSDKEEIRVLNVIIIRSRNSDGGGSRSCCRGRSSGGGSGGGGGGSSVAVAVAVPVAVEKP